MEKPENANPEPNQELDEEEMEGVSGGILPSAIVQGGSLLTFPDTCKTPSEPSPVPVPYPNVGSVSDSTATKKTKTDE
jgi:hypothetical protein